ncbi:MAG: 23S rRNA (pseudouridine(1915)-N(3))-methyltransferase RlmH [Tannerellaceae bacterium]|jgi:23S rRNA (pseudouridine1915-N3)-methyltransferase|nr:23S rRNA (pseudouridine(1915)-N(3))-methyltransferase RlmH [Tannerellaceae bacterium]
MKIVLAATGKTDAAWLREGICMYCERLTHYFPFEIRTVPDVKNARNISEEQQKEKEGEAILKILQPGDYCVLLDEKGGQFTSLQFAAYLEKKTHAVRRLVFIAGGPYGFGEAVYKAAQEKISISNMTFSHQLIRLIFLEQLYRACTIIRREPYHHG